MSDLLHKVALSRIPKVGSKTAKTLIAYCGSAEAVFKTTKGKLLKIPGIGELIATEILKKESLAIAESEIEKAHKDHTRLLFFTDEDYPFRLKQINDAPPLIYFKGDADLNSAKILAVVGTRQITNYGKECIDHIFTYLKNSKILIVSGLAYGVDIYAHKKALEFNLPTLGVMANGMHQIYPSIHRSVAEKMLQNGGLMTEECFDTKASGPRFPARNRIVAGLSDGVLVVESAESGGSLITADLAFGYNKEVMAIPGNFTQKYSEGCNNLIKENKAQLITSAEDIIKTLNWDLETTPIPIIRDFSAFEGDERKILELLIKEGEQSIDQITWKLQISPNMLASKLLELEFEGMINALPGKKYLVK